MENKRINDEATLSPVPGIAYVGSWDAKIISKINEIVGALNLYTLQAVVESWKTIPDQDVFYALDQILDQLSSPEEGEEGEGKKSTWIQVGSVLLKLHLISTLEKTIVYDLAIEDYKSAILLNRQTEGLPLLFANTTIAFESQEERDRTFNKIQTALKKNGAVFIES